MEQLNKVTLIGVVSNACSSKVSDEIVTRFSLATNMAYKDRQGGVVIETTFHNVVAFEKSGLIEASCLTKGDKVRVEGRIRNVRYVAEDGSERTSSEIYAAKVEKIDDSEPLQYQL